MASKMITPANDIPATNQFPIKGQLSLNLLQLSLTLFPFPFFFLLSRSTQSGTEIPQLKHAEVDQHTGHNNTVTTLRQQ